MGHCHYSSGPARKLSTVNLTCILWSPQTSKSVTQMTTNQTKWLTLAGFITRVNESEDGFWF